MNKKMNRSSLALVFGIVLSATTFAPANAADLVWDNIRIAGGGSQVGCTANSMSQDIFWNSFGGDISFVFTKLGITLDNSIGFSGFKMTASTSCTIDAWVTIPQGHFVASIAQTLTGGIIKDRGTVAGITSNAFLFSNQIPINQINIYSAANQTIDATTGMLARNNTQTFDHTIRVIQCATTATQSQTTSFRLNIAAIASRLLPFQQVLINLDASDLSYQLTPTLLPCSSSL